MTPKKPFGRQDYPDPRTRAQRHRERTEVVKQVRDLATRAVDNAERRRRVGRIQRRRVRLGDAVQIELIPRPGRLDLVAASHRLLIRDGDLTAATSTALGRLGIVAAARTGGVVRLDVPPDAEPAGISALAARLRADGVPVSLDHVAPLGAWMKGDGGPEPTGGRRRYPAVAVVGKSPPPIVAVLDTGISNAGRTDGYLGAEVSPADVDPLDVFPATGLLDGDAGHGSMVVGVVQQVVPCATVGSYRVADSDGIATTFGVAEQMRLAVQQGATILNLSLGTGTEDDDPPVALLDVVDELRDDHPDVLIVCAAGNNADTAEVWPAAFAPTHPNVIAVAALDGSGAPAPWSTHGPWVTCSTIGQGVASTYVVGTEDGALIGDPAPDTFRPPNPWAVWSGTSFAAPQVAGAVARICAENVGVAPPQACKMLEALATPAAPGSGYGWTVELLPGT